MLTATKAIRETAVATRRINRERKNAAKLAEKKARDQVKWELKVEMPKHLRGINKEVKSAIAAGRKTAHFYVNYSISHEVVDAIKKRLTKRGFVVQHGYHSGTADMGDFNAPCMTDWSDTTFDISWGKQRTDDNVSSWYDNEGR